MSKPLHKQVEDLLSGATETKAVKAAKTETSKAEEKADKAKAEAKTLRIKLDKANERIKALEAQIATKDS